MITRKTKGKGRREASKYLETLMGGPLTSFDRAQFLAACDVIDWQSDALCGLAARLTAGAAGLDVISILFNWVRDSIAHTGDVGRGKITLSASEVFRERTGLCYAKSHLLVALLRATNIPAGLCYQRLRSGDGPPSFVLHGLVGVLMPDHRSCASTHVGTNRASTLNSHQGTKRSRSRPLSLAKPTFQVSSLAQFRQWLPHSPVRQLATSASRRAGHRRREWSRRWWGFGA
jgi:hypothetical protein